MILNMIAVIIVVLAVASTVNIIDNEIKRRDSLISFKESMDLTELPVVTFYNGNTKLNFLLDTGSNYSYINSSIIPLLDIKEINEESTIIGIEGNAVTTNMCSMNIYYKKQSFDLEFCVMNLDAAFDRIKQNDGVQIHGILGSKFFEKYKYILDFNRLIAYIE